MQATAADLNTALRLGPKIPASILRVAESGIGSGQDIRRLRDAGFQAFLIGESLMRADSPGDALRHLITQAQAPPGSTTRPVGQAGTQD